jgi:hypothetical protein
MSLEPVLAGSSAATHPFDEVSKAWLVGLQASGAEHERCIAELHDLLLRVAPHETSRRSTSFRLAGPEFDDVVNQVADDALMAIKAKVTDFRGESPFTTWAYHPRLDSLRQRCPMTTVDPDTLELDKEVLRDINHRFGGRLALNAAIIRAGTIKTGDAVSLIRRPTPSQSEQRR